MGWLPLRFVVIKKIFYAQTENSSKTDWISNVERDCQYSTLKHEEIKAMPKNIYSPNSPKKSRKWRPNIHRICRTATDWTNFA